MLPLLKIHKPYNASLYKKNPVVTVKLVVILLVLALAVKLPFALFLSLPLAGDAKGYFDISVNLARQGSFSVDGSNPTSDRVFVYPAMLASMHLLFGISQSAPIILNLVLSALSAIFVFLTAYKLFDRKIAILAYVFMLILPGINLHIPTIMSENASIFFLSIFIYLMFGVKKHSRAIDLLCALSFTLLVFSRQSMVFAAVGLVLILLITDDKTMRRKAGISLLMLLLVMHLWAWRNLEQTGTFAYFGTEGKISVYIGTRVEFLGQSQGLPLKLENGQFWNKDKTMAAVYNEYSDPEQRKDALWNLAKDTIIHEPLGVALIGTYNTFYGFWMPPYAYNFLVKDYLWSTGYDLSSNRFIMVFLANLYLTAWVIFLISCLVGIWQMKLDESYVFFVAVCVCSAVFTSLLGPIPRYHTSILPLMAILAATGVRAAWLWLARRWP